MSAKASQPLSAQIDKGARRKRRWPTSPGATGEVLVVGSSSAEPVSRVFLSSRATKILTTPRCPSSSSLRAVAVEGPTAS